MTLKTDLNEAILAGNVGNVTRLLQQAPLSNEDIEAALKSANDSSHENVAKAIYAHRRDDKGNTELHFAAYQGNLALATELIQLGADVNAQNRNNDTPLHLAAAYNHINVVKLLFQNMALTEVSNNAKVTPLQLSLLKVDSKENRDVVNFLIKNRREPSGDTSSESSQSSVVAGIDKHSVFAKRRNSIDCPRSLNSQQPVDNNRENESMRCSAIDYSS